jgi:hypothetical protein
MAAGGTCLAIDRHRRHAILAGSDFINRKALEVIFALQHVGQSLVDLGLVWSSSIACLNCETSTRLSTSSVVCASWLPPSLTWKFHQLADPVTDGADLALQETPSGD